jgi:hypothetical protein
VSRTVTLVLVDVTGSLLGALPPFDVTEPWWQEVHEIVAAARARDGLDVQVLRLLHGDREHPPGGHVTYLGQVTTAAPVGLAPVAVDLSPQPLRNPYAEPGGPAATTRWAVSALEALGSPGAIAWQIRTWNLSAIWRLDVAGAPVAWLKQVPTFFRHEAATLGLVSGIAPGLVPPLLAVGEEGRMLLAHVPGDDRYGAGADVCSLIDEEFHPVQAALAGRVDDLLAAGMPDNRLTPEPYARVAEPYLDRIDGLAELIDDLPRRFEEIAACGLPDTLVHGDLHPGNTRVDGRTITIMDWGDSSAGNPALDILRLTEHLDAGDAETLQGEWAARWQAAVPGSDPMRAAELMRPVAPLRGAVVYAGFLAGIELAEHPYHAADIPDRLTAAVAAART